MQHTKKLRVIITIAFIVLNCGILITIFAKFIISCKLLDEYTRINIFEDISALDVVKTTEAELTDEYISDLSVLRSFVHGVAYNSETFEIYAYEFETVEDAKKYSFLSLLVSLTFLHPHIKQLDNGFFHTLRRIGARKVFLYLIYRELQIPRFGFLLLHHNPKH